MVLSGFMWGYLADVKGRKKIILYGYLADSICNILAGFSQNFETLVFFKFLSGFMWEKYNIYIYITLYYINSITFRRKATNESSFKNYLTIELTASFIFIISVSGPHATLLAYCSEFFGDKGRAKIPLIVGFSTTFGCVINAGKITLYYKKII